MRERTVFASFYSEAEAQKAAEQVKTLGIEVAQVDELHLFEPPQAGRDSFLISGKIPSLAEITLDANVDRDTGVLLATDPSASGMTDGQSNVTGRNYLLTVIAPEPRVDAVVTVIKDCNGYT